MARRYLYVTAKPDNYRNIASGMMRLVAIIVRANTEKLRDRMHESMLEPKHGHTYRKPGGGIHIASAPGEAPAVYGGDLSKSLETRFTNGGWIGVAGSFGDVDYAHKLEKGIGLKPRPFASPALDQIADDFVNDLRLALR